MDLKHGRKKIKLKKLYLLIQSSARIKKSLCSWCSSLKIEHCSSVTDIDVLSLALLQQVNRIPFSLRQICNIQRHEVTCCLPYSRCRHIGECKLLTLTSRIFSGAFVFKKWTNIKWNAVTVDHPHNAPKEIRQGLQYPMLQWYTKHYIVIY